MPCCASDALPDCTCDDRIGTAVDGFHLPACPRLAAMREEASAIATLVAAP